MFLSQGRRPRRGRPVHVSAKSQPSRPFIEELESRQLLSGLGLGLGRFDPPDYLTVTVVSLTVPLSGPPARGLGEVVRIVERGPSVLFGTRDEALEITRAERFFQRLAALEERALSPANELF